MTDQELIEAVAVEILGWEKVGTQNNGWWSPKGQPDGIIVTQCDTSYGPGWNPITDMNHTMMVIERMRKCLFWFDIFDNYNEVGNLTDRAWYCNFTRKDPKVRGYAKNKSIGHAICLAALEAVRSMQS